MAMPYDEMSAKQMAYAQVAEAPRNSPFDSLASVVSFLREIDAMADKLAHRMVGADHKLGNLASSGAVNSTIAAVPNLLDRLEGCTGDLREIGESIAHHLRRIESRL